MTTEPRTPWTEADIPAQHGRIAVVTGANSGLGFETARVLAERGATVALVCRSIGRAETAAERIRETAPDAEIRTVRADLLSLMSVRAAAEQLRAEFARIDLLVNNAGTTFARRTESADGFEATIATNHLGPFALTGLLLDRIAPHRGARIVTVGSLLHHRAPLDLDDLHCANRRYRNMVVYGQSKLANLMFTLELQRRLAAAGAPAIATAAHPGSVHTAFGDNMGPLSRQLNSGVLRPLVGWTQQPAAVGALATLRAATDPAAVGAEYFGPADWREMRGNPERARISEYATDPDANDLLWRESERSTRVVYDFGALATAVGRA
ncbi:oxidoreductase [Nocardia asteroides]|uniref:oxidoreductase n=1 Tax=Nocardia asteroides TaxID=1824 RepID=UPI001E4DBD5E|nr:oxidoreductase [Nocardia asteroides]UGT62233.1 SDR family NAD(P)-dependent oxidoreductase [Nocardia asteroides]